MTANAGTVTFIRHTLIALGLIALVLLLWQVAYALLLAFGGVLFAVFLRGVAGKLSEWTHLGMCWALALTGFALLALFATAVALIGPAIAEEMGELGQALTEGFETVRSYVAAQPWGKPLVESISQGNGQGGKLLSVAAGIIRGAADALLALVLVLFAGIYLAVSPSAYRDGLVRLLPQARQRRACEVLDATGDALWLWLLGRLVVMLTVAVITTIALLIIGVPLAVALGIIAGLLEFIPFLGPILAAVPVVLVALTVAPDTALVAAVVVLLIQQVEGNILEPLVERKAVSLPPVLVLIGTIAFILLFGIVGAVFATPLLVVAMVCVQMLYVEDTLGQRAQVPGRPSP